MQIGLFIDEDRPLPDVLMDVESAAQQGYARAWLAQRFGWDAATVLAALGGRAPGIAVGTAVVPTYPSHPIALARQALTAAAATGGRLTLGVGPSHQVIIEGAFGYPWDRPARHTRDYLEVLAPLLRGEAVDVHGETVTAVGSLSTPKAPPVPLLISALGPVLLRLAGERADGTVTAWTGPRGLAEHVVPAITRAAAGRPAPQVVATVLVCVTDRPDEVREAVTGMYGRAGDLPSYRAVLDREGRAGPADTAELGDEAGVERAIRRYADAGATEFMAAFVGTAQDQARTRAFLADLAPTLR